MAGSSHSHQVLLKVSYRQIPNFSRPSTRLPKQFKDFSVLWNLTTFQGWPWIQGQCRNPVWRGNTAHLLTTLFWVFLQLIPTSLLCPPAVVLAFLSANLSLSYLHLFLTFLRLNHPMLLSNCRTQNYQSLTFIVLLHLLLVVYPVPNFLTNSVLSSYWLPLHLMNLSSPAI